MVSWTAEAVVAVGVLTLASGYIVDEPKTRSRKASSRHLLSSMLLTIGGVAVTGGLGVLLDQNVVHGKAHPTS